MTDIHIGGIRIRAENLTPTQGQQLGERIAMMLSEALVNGDAAPRDVAMVQARVKTQGGESIDQLAAQVVSAILQAM
jgi:hypothetical protein